MHALCQKAILQQVAGMLVGWLAGCELQLYSYTQPPRDGVWLSLAKLGKNLKDLQQDLYGFI